MTWFSWKPLTWQAALMNIVENVFIFIKDLLSAQKAISLMKWKKKKERKGEKEREGAGLESRIAQMQCVFAVLGCLYPGGKPRLMLVFGKYHFLTWRYHTVYWNAEWEQLVVQSFLKSTTQASKDLNQDLEDPPDGMEPWATWSSGWQPCPQQGVETGRS